MTAARILIVEDEAVVALDLRKRLTQLGYEVVETVGLGELAVQRAAQDRPDLILMDIRLRGEMDGIEAAEIIRRQLNLPVVYLTAHADEATVSRARVTEPFGYILKPFDERELRTIIEMALYKHQAEKKLRESEQRYATTLSSIGDAVIATDNVGRVTFMNSVAESLTGWPVSEAQAVPLTTVFRICSESTRATVENPVDRVLAEGIIVGLANHTILVSRDGTEYPIDDCAAPIRDIDGNMTGAVLVFRDVSQTRHFENQLQQAQKMEAIGQLAAGIAHDFNNMLTVILNYTSMLLDSAGSDHPWSSFLTEIQLAAQRSTELTQQLLTFSRRRRVDPKILNLNETVLQCEQILRRLISENIEIQFRLQPEVGNIRIDAGQLEQILINLCLNARDAMPGQGRLIIETDRVEIAMGDFPNLAPGDYAVLRVTDEGQGIPGEIQHRVFEPFFTTKEPGKGTGLGLAMVYSIVQQNSGYVAFESSIGEGTTFAIYLPLAAAIVPSQESAAAMSLPEGTETILLVEDEASVRLLSQRILSKCGYTILEANDGAAALKIAELHGSKIDIVLTDIVMPVMGAKEMLRHIGKFLPSLRVLLMSGYSDDDVLDGVQGIVAAGFLPKPFSVPDLAHAIRRVLDETN